MKRAIAAVVLGVLLTGPVQAAHGAKVALPPVQSRVVAEGVNIVLVTRPSVEDLPGGGQRLTLETELSELLRRMPSIINGVKKDEECGERMAFQNAKTALKGGEVLVDGHMDYAWRGCGGMMPDMAQGAKFSMAMKPVILGADRVGLAARTLGLRLDQEGLGGSYGEQLEPLLRHAMDSYLKGKLSSEEYILVLPPEVKALKPQIKGVTLLDSPAPKLTAEAEIAKTDVSVIERMLRSTLQP